MCIRDSYCVIVPFMLWVVAGKRPTLANVGAAGMCIVGIGLVSVSYTHLDVYKRQARVSNSSKGA